MISQTTSQTLTTANRYARSTTVEWWVKSSKIPHTGKIANLDVHCSTAYCHLSSLRISFYIKIVLSAAIIEVYLNDASK